MATEHAFPAYGSVSSTMTPGERRVYQRLQKKLPPDCWFWYDQPVGGRDAWADFVILSPDKGLLLLEVKDWKLDTIVSASREAFEIRANGGVIKRVASPLTQAWRNLTQLMQHLQKDRTLLQQEGPHRGKPAFPYACGVVLTGITRRQFDKAGLDAVLPPEQVICSDEMTESVPDGVFQQRLWAMRPHVFPVMLDSAAFDRVRWYLFPEVRVVPKQASLLPEWHEMPLDEQVRMLDAEQEKVARSMGEGHRVIHGVSGSGKTLVLTARARFLAYAGEKPVLVVCYNRSLAAFLQQQLEDVADRVEVWNYHRWASEALKRCGVVPGRIAIEEWSAHLLKGFERGCIPREHYAALLIDEGHDFEPDWIRTLLLATRNHGDPRRQQVLFLYDDAQNIYHGDARAREGLGFTLSHVGIQAQGRTAILRHNYRNSRAIMEFSYRFLQSLLSDAGEGDAAMLAPEPGDYLGEPPLMAEYDSAEARAEAIADWLRQLHEDKDVEWNDMAVIYLQHNDAKPVIDAFKAAGIPFFQVRTSEGKSNMELWQDKVKLITAHSAKGLEFEAVAVIGAEHVTDGQPAEETLREGKQLYVAMTRARRYLNVLLLKPGSESNTPSAPQSSSPSWSDDDVPF